ncbi:GNAT family N-acetyltransferase [Halalkalibacter krulwichiae]|uniref:Putative acetyltransferase n=1 Tax=Halalkalibacter krulwichiae TaxID=199441 RepID=A0A1X9MDJ9_9BACI|nr:GNAT family N-acetyltransferase [Halalkalibacter krulwichiae]ARK31486.1 putative acetyltransferase [Halalkalibacter krulwichiae]
MDVKKLESEHVESFRTIRLQALEQVPKAFAASFEEEADKPIAFFEDQLLSGSCFYGLFNHGGELVGIVSLTRSKLKKMKHKASIGSVFIKKEERGKGMAKALLQYAMESAKNEGVEQIQLVVAANNQKAKQLYESLGFKTYGYEKRALKLDQVYLDEEHMVKIVK